MLLFLNLPHTSVSDANRSIEIRGMAEGIGINATSRLTFIGTEGSAALSVICDVTLFRTTGHRTPKVSGTRFGRVTALQVNRGGSTRSPSCGHGSFIREVHDIVPLSLPTVPARHREVGGNVLLYDLFTSEWHLIYDSFQGTLPRIEGINFHIQGFKFSLFLLEPFGGTIECLYEGNAFGLFEIRETGTLERASAVRALTRFSRTRGSTMCPGSGSLEGSFNLQPRLTIILL